MKPGRWKIGPGVEAGAGDLAQAAGMAVPAVAGVVLAVAGVAAVIGKATVEDAGTATKSAMMAEDLGTAGKLIDF
jgi:hypothetical protein